MSRKLLIEKFKESATSILPIVGIVLAVSLTPLFSLPVDELKIFIISAISLIVGMTLFNIGAGLSMTLMGDYAGSALMKTKKITLILSVALFMGILITIAEPDLIVLSQQVKDVVNSSTFIMSVAVGVGVFLVIALLRTIFNRQLATLLLLFYMLIFALSALLIEIDKWSLLPLAFDSGGVTTGPITVPFIMAFGVGIATTLGGKNGNENSFGFVALCSVGPILVVLISLIMSKGTISYTLPNYTVQAMLEGGLLHKILEEGLNVFKALGLIFGFFLILNFLIIKLPIKKLLQIVTGLLITFAGLVIFLTTASIGFLPVGYSLGSQIMKSDRAIVIGLCFIIGMTVVLAEPAIHVLTSQVETVTGGSVSRRSMLIALSIGVGFAIALSVVRIMLGFSIIFYLIPGYFISLALSLFVPPLYTAIAFDSGGVASGPLTSTFIVPFMIGACVECAGVENVLEFAFGVVALVAMIPLITIQLLGFRAVVSKILRDRISMTRILRADDNQIIYFEGNV